MISPEQTERQKAQLALMGWLNDRQRRYGGTFDFGNLGLLQIWQGRFGWEWEWLKVEKVPEEVWPVKESYV